MVDINRKAELRTAIEAMFFAYRAFTSGPDRMLEKRGLNRVHHRILYFIGRQPGLSVTELLQVLQISKQALNMPLRQLLNMNLVGSEQSADDGRVRELRLTAEGKRLESKLSGTQMSQLQAVFEASGKDAEQGWHRVMKALHSE